MQINKDKTELLILNCYKPQEINDMNSYNRMIQQIQKDYGHLNHGKANALGKITSSFYLNNKTNPHELRIMNEIKGL